MGAQQKFAAAESEPEWLSTHSRNRAARPTGSADAGPVSATGAMERFQRAYGNRAAQRVVQRSKAPAAAGSDAVSLPNSPGRPLDLTARKPLERHFAADLSDVRIHSDSAAARSAQLIGAAAFTSGRDIYFGPGMFSPGGGEGQRLLAHEVAHVVQQNAGSSPGVQAKPSGDVGIVAEPNPLEAEAERSAEAFASGTNGARAAFVNSPAPVPRLQRKLAVDPTKAELTRPAAADMTDEELKAQLAIVKTALDARQPTDPDYDRLRLNRRVMEETQVLRNLKKAPTGDFAATDQSLDAKVARFKSAVLTSAYIRLTRNQESLAQWRTFITTKLSAIDVQRQASAQITLDLAKTAQEHQSEMALYNWAGERNPYMRWVYEQQAKGRFHACTGCHAMMRADELGKQESHFGAAWQAPSERLAQMAGMIPPGAILDPNQAAARRLSGADLGIALYAAERIRPVLEPLGPYGYQVIPEETMSLLSNSSPDQLRSAIVANIEKRDRQYSALKGMILDGSVEYSDLTPVLADLLAMAAPDVAGAIRDELRWKQIKAILSIIGTIIATLLAILIPPLGIVVAAYQFSQGYGQFRQGYAYMLGTGANDVFTREQQESAGELMAGGVTTMAMSAAAIAGSIKPSVQWTAGAVDLAATQAIIRSDAVIARNLAQRALAGPIPEAELLAMQRTGLVGRMAHGWAETRGFQILYRGQGAATSELLSPLARTPGGVGASESMYSALKAQGLTDQEIAGMTARWGDQPVPFSGLMEGGAGIPTTRLPNIASAFARGEQGVIYVLRVPRTLPVEVGVAGWGRMSALESEYVIFHQIPNGYVVRTLPGSSFVPLEYVEPLGGGPSLQITPAQPTQ